MDSMFTNLFWLQEPQYNKAIIYTTNKLWHPDSFYNNVQNINRHLLLSFATGFKPETMQKRASKISKEKAKRHIEIEQVEEFNKSDYVRVKLSSIYSETRKEVKSGDKKY